MRRAALPKLSAPVRTARHHLTAILLVLLHVLGPGLHWMQHAVEGFRDGSGGAGVAHCGHASCQAKMAPAGAAERALRAPGLDATERSDQQHDHDCALCSQLHRLHGYVAPSVAFDAAAVALARRCGEIAPANPCAVRPNLPPSRAPPLSLA